MKEKQTNPTFITLVNSQQAIVKLSKASFDPYQKLVVLRYYRKAIECIKDYFQIKQEVANRNYCSPNGVVDIDKYLKENNIKGNGGKQEKINISQKIIQSINGEMVKLNNKEVDLPYLKIDINKFLDSEDFDSCDIDQLINLGITEMITEDQYKKEKEK